MKNVVFGSYRSVMCKVCCGSRSRGERKIARMQQLVTGMFSTEYELDCKVDQGYKKMSQTCDIKTRKVRSKFVRLKPTRNVMN